MKTISTALQNFLLSNTVFGRADLITITLPNGTILHVVSGNNTDITYSGVTYYCSRFGVWQRGAFENSASFKLSASSMELTAFISEAVLYPGTSTALMQVVSAGMLSGSQVSIQTLFWPQGGSYTAGISMGTMQLNVGQIGNVKSAGRSKIVCEVFDLIYMLNRPVPPFTLHSACRHTLFDPGCTLLVANFQSTNVPLSSSSTSLYLNLNAAARQNSHAYLKGDLISVSNIPYVAVANGTSAGSPPVFNSTRGALTTDGGVNWRSMNNGYPLGYIIFTSGQNNGLKMSIKTQVIASGIQLQLIKPLPFPVAGGDNVQLVPGCDKTLGVCETVYNNLIHFGGTPFTPNPETAS